MTRSIHRFFFALLLAALAVGSAGAQVPNGDLSARALQLDQDRAKELFHEGHFTAAREIFADIAHRQDRAGQAHSRNQAVVLFNLGSASASAGDLASAVLAFRRSLAVFEEMAEEDDLDTALALEGLASVLLQQENLEEAQACIDRALAVRTAHFPENHPQRARLYALGATVAQMRGDIEGTEELYYKALMAYRRIHGNVHPIVAEIIQNIGTFYTDTGSFQAEIMFRQAADVASLLHGPGHPLRAVSLTNFGRLRWTEGRYSEAEEFLQEALGIHDKLGARSSPDLAVCLFQMGRVQLAQDRYREAAVTLERAAAVYESAWWRAGMGAERSLAVMSPYPLLAVAQLHLGQTEEALGSFNAHQGRLATLSGMLRDLPRDLAARRDSLIEELSRREEDLVRLEVRWAVARDSRVREDLALARGAQAEAETRWLAFQTQVSSGTLQDSDLTTADYQAQLLDGEAAVGWLETAVRPDKHVGWAFVIRPDQDLVWVNLPTVADRWDSPGELAQAAVAEIRGNEVRAFQATGDLRAMATQPLEAHLRQADRLLVIPSSFMAGIPAEMFFQGDRQIVYVPYLPRERNTAASARLGPTEIRVLVVADPPFSRAQHSEAVAAGPIAYLPGPSVLRSALGGNRQAIETLPRLAGTRNEADVLDALFPGTTVLMGDRASENELRTLARTRELGRFDIIHLATHALIDAERPGRSALVLSQLDRTDDPAGDGLLTVREISRTWKLNSELVTLSACATGLGRRIDGEGFLGFTQSLMGAGTRNVLVSLWPVDDQATALLMEHFYGSLAGRVEMTPTAALREARIWLRDYTSPAGTRPFAAPRFWAGFVMFSRLD